MDKLIPDVLARLAADSELVTTRQLSVYGDRQPDDPSTLTTPVLVATVAGWPEAPERHGGATYPLLEMHLWGYETFGRSRFGPLVQIGQRIDELMMLPFAPAQGGVTNRFSSTIGWQRVEDTDPRVVHFINRYEALYWQTQRLTARTS